VDAPVEFGIYLPQVAFSWDQVRDRAQWMDELGYHSIWFMDHLYPPMMPAVPSFEAWTLATAVLSVTERLRCGHMVLCNGFRHPALLGKMATSLDLISGGRLDLGIGSGSVEIEHHEAGIEWPSFGERTERLGESLEILARMFTGEPTTFEGKHYSVKDLPNLPPPVQSPRPPIHIGGSGPKTLEVVARHADVWNCPTYALAELDTKLDALRAACERIGRDASSIRMSTEAVLALAPDEASLSDARALAERRFGGSGFGLEAGGYIGTPEMIVDRIRENVEKGITLFIFFTHDRGSRQTLELFAERVMPAFA
jgi:alkanesulfonate monooxygenase SsuD/methylene tetrahydromethanopterin reductase-like flavin-dependent oxidoreductase (luciferase family)